MSINLTYDSKNVLQDTGVTTHTVYSWHEVETLIPCPNFFAHLDVDYVFLGSGQMEVDKVHYSRDVSREGKPLSGQIGLSLITDGVIEMTLITKQQVGFVCVCVLTCIQYEKQLI